MSLSDRIEVWLRLRDAARFTHDAYRAGEAVEGIGKSADKANRQLRLLEAANAAAGKGLRVAGLAAAYLVGGLGLVAGAAGAAVGVLGLKFNSTMEQLQIGFTHFLGSTQKATVYLNKLWKLAAETPFEFQQLAGAAQQLMAFGSSAESAYSQLKILGDAAAGLGTGTEGIDRMVLALGQMQVAGVVQGDELRQFQEAGINVYKYMEKAGLITRKDIGKIGDMHIDAAKAIDAIMTGMQRDFGGLSKAQSRTLQGQLSTMKDNASATAGALTEPLFGLLKSKVLPRINKELQQMSKWARQGGLKQDTTNFRSALAAGQTGMDASKSAGFPTKAGIALGKAWAAVFPLVQKGVRTLTYVWSELMGALKPAKPFLQNVLIPLLKGFGIGLLASIVTGFKLFIVIVKGAAYALGAFGTVMRPFRMLFFGAGFAISFIFGGAILKAMKFLGLFGKALAFPINFVDKLIGRFVLFAIALWKFRRIIGLVGKGIGFVSNHAKILNAIMRPLALIWKYFGWLIGPFIIPRIAKVLNPLRTFRGVVAGINGVIRIMVRLIGAAARAITGLADKITGPVGDAIGSVKKILGGTVGRLGGIPFHAAGGVIPSGGIGIVGDAGPELASAGPGGTRITPLSRGGGSSDNMKNGIHVHSYITLEVGGKPLARVTADQVANWRARKGQNS